MTEERAEIPRAHAEALIDVAAGTVAYDRVAVSIGEGRRGLLDCFLLPAGLDLLTAVLEDGSDPPLWLGPEVTGQPAYEKGSLAREGLPQHPEVEVSNRMLDALL